MLLILKFKKMVSIGQELKRERELRGISLKEIADTTKINLRLLRAIEEDQTDTIPSEFFIKAIIRAHAKYIGLEEEAVLNKYHELALRQENSLQMLEEESKKRPPRSTLPRNLRNLIRSLIIIIIILAAFAIFYFFFYQKKIETSSPAKQDSGIIKKEASIPQEKIKLPEEIKPLPVITTKKKSEEINIELTFLQETWIQVYSDSVLNINSIKHAGDVVKTIAKNELLIHLGNAGGISYTLNGQTGKKLGTSGEVVRNIKITLDNILEFIEK
ncbi:helix-turn-helix domain-containing protein [Acidobacteriota bacterium]